jgi:signal transduction protein with GAF and PtsI domain
MSATPPDPALACLYLADPVAAEAALHTALGASADRREAAWQLAEHAGRLLDLQDCVVYLLAPSGDALQQVAAWGPKQVAPRIFENPITLPVGHGIVGACARDRVPVLVADTRLDARYVLDDEPRLSELAVPILRGDALLGVIDSEHAAADAYRSEHVRALLRLAAVFATRGAG